jgi:hypothetical protein
MPKSGEGVVTRLVARVRALLPKDWFGRAGNRLQETTEAVSNFADEHHLRPDDLLEEGIELGRRKVEGLANKEYAAAAKDFAETEQKKIETELQRRTVNSKVRKEEAEARIAELKVLDAEVELFEKMKRIGVILRRDENGNLTVLPTPANCDLLELIERKRLRGANTEDEVETQLSARHSNGLDHFVSYFKGETTGLSILDLAGVNRSNVTFITKLGHRIYSEDVLRSLQLADNSDAQPRADTFLSKNLNHADGSFDGVLVWDVLEYLSPSLLTATVERLYRIVKPGGCLLAVFQTHENALLVPQYLFRIQDSKTLLLGERGQRKREQLFNNRSLEALFQKFESLKFFLARDKLREVIVRR